MEVGGQVIAVKICYEAGGYNTVNTAIKYCPCPS